MKRLIKVLQWNIIGNKREIRRSFTGMVTAYCIITAANCLSAWCDSIAPYSNTLTSAKLCLVGTGFAMLFWASQVCFNMATKTTFINYAMLPATNAEKYVANVIYQTLCRIVIAMAAIIAADALQAIVSLLMAGDANSLTLCVMTSFKAIVQADGIYSLAMLAIFAHSTFVLGGTFFRRRQFLLTCLMWVAVPFITSTLFFLAAGVLHSLYDFSEYDISLTLWFSTETYDTILTLLQGAATCLCYWLSYRLFRRSQVINNKFFN